MLTTIDMVRDVISDLGENKVSISLASGYTSSFRTVALLPSNLNAELLSDVLYVTTEGDAHLNRGQKINYITVYENADLAVVFNSIQEAFLKVSQLTSELELVIVKHQGLQALLDVIEPHFNNPIVALNKSLTPIAVTRNVPFNHPELIAMSQKGQFTEQMIADISNQEYLERDEGFLEIGFNHPPNYLGCTKIVKAFKPNPLHLNLVCLFGVNAEPTDGDLDKLRYITEQIERYAITYAAREIVPEQPSQKDIYIIIDLLEGNVDEQELMLKKSLLDLPLDAEFRMLYISCESDIRTRANHMASHLQWHLPMARAFVYKSKVLVLVEACLGVSDIEIIQGKIKTILDTHRAVCGISSKFYRLADVKDGYLQAFTACTLGMQLDPSRTYYHYHDYYIYHLLLCGSKELALKQLYDNQLDVLMHAESVKGMDYIHTLEIYLNCDRSISATAKELYLHRNSVIYRLEKIEEILGTSLDDPETRLRLIVSLKALRLIHAMNEY